MTHPTADSTFPNPEQRTALNAALLTDNTETGFWDDQGRPAPWPDDIDQWTPDINKPGVSEPGEQPF